MARYLVVANQTLGGERLMDEIRRRVAAGPSSFHVLVPAIPVDVVPGVVMMGETGVTAAVAAEMDRAGDAARHRAETTTRSRLNQLMGLIRAEGSEAEGDVGDSDPVKAIGALLADEQFDEIIISTLPQAVSRWLRMDVPHRVERKFKLPVTTVTAKE